MKYHTYLMSLLIYLSVYSQQTNTKLTIKHLLAANAFCISLRVFRQTGVTDDGFFCILS